jgi:lysophospholipase L1-like esterase
MDPRGKTTGTPGRIAHRSLASLLVVLVLAASLSLVMGAQGQLQVSATGATRIMAAGDSNTLGVGTPEFGGYRVSLSQILSSRGFAFDMVGTQWNGPAELPDKAHEGYGGYTIDDLAGIMPDKLTLNPPDVVLLMIGSNDVTKGVDLPNAPTRLGHLLDLILARPSVQRVILSTIPPFNLDWPEGQQAIRDYNAALPGVVSGRSNVTLVDVYPQIDPATDMADGVHLNPSGAAKLGALFADAVLGAPPPPPPPPGPIGTTLTLTTSQNPSEINETVTVSGRLLDASGAGVVGRTVQLEWSSDQVTWYPEGQIGQFPATDANGAFAGTMAFRPNTPRSEYIRAWFAGDATYAASSSPIVTQTVVAPPTSPPTDPTPPQVSATMSGIPGANGWFVSPVTVTLTVTGGTTPTIRYRIDDTPWTSYRVPFQVPEGRHMVQYQGVDGNGSFGPSKTEYFDIDETAPIVAANARDLVLAPEAPLTWTGSDALSGIAGYAVSVDGGSFRMIGAQPRVDGPWAAGSHSVIVKADDEAGNVATTTITFHVDASTPPTKPAPEPAPSLNTLTEGPVLAMFAIALAGAGGLLYGPARRGRTAAGKGRKPIRKNSTPSRRLFDDPDDDTDSLL